jgi:hypothetical protein
MESTIASSRTAADYASVATALTELVALAPNLRVGFFLSFHVNERTGEVESYNTGLDADAVREWGQILGQYESRKAQSGCVHHTAEGIVGGVQFTFVAIEDVTA